MTLWSTSLYVFFVWLGYVAVAAKLLWPYSRTDSPQVPDVKRSGHWPLAIIILFHAPAAFTPLLGSAPHFGAAEALSLLTWLAVVIYWIAAWLIRVDGLQTILVPVAATILGISQLIPHGHATPWLAKPLMQIHFGIAMLAYGFLAVAAGLAVLMRLADAKLHRPSQTLLGQLPPLLTLERVMFSTLGLGFVLLTATLATGIVFSELLFGYPARLNHKVLFSLVAWLIFGGLLWGRLMRGWRGRMAVNWTLAGFATLLLAYIGSRFVLDIILQR